MSVESSLLRGKLNRNELADKLLLLDHSILSFNYELHFYLSTSYPSSLVSEKVTVHFKRYEALILPTMAAPTRHQGRLRAVLVNVPFLNHSHNRRLFRV